MVRWGLPNDIINVVITSQAKVENIGGRFYKKSKKSLNDQSCKLSIGKSKYTSMTYSIYLFEP